MGGVVVAATEGDLRHLLVGAAEEAARVFDPPAGQPLERRFAVSLFEHAQEMEAAQSRLVREAVERVRLAEVLAEVASARRIRPSSRRASFGAAKPACVHSKWTARKLAAVSAYRSGAPDNTALCSASQIGRAHV